MSSYEVFKVRQIAGHAAAFHTLGVARLPARERYQEFANNTCLLLFLSRTMTDNASIMQLGLPNKIGSIVGPFYVLYTIRLTL